MHGRDGHSGPGSFGDTSGHRADGAGSHSTSHAESHQNHHDTTHQNHSLSLFETDTTTASIYGEQSTATQYSSGARRKLALILGVTAGLVGFSYPLSVFISAVPTWIIILVVGFVVISVGILWRAVTSEGTPGETRAGPASETHTGSAGDTETAAVERLKVQYANGEIDEKELKYRLDTLDNREIHESSVVDETAAESAEMDSEVLLKMITEATDSSGVEVTHSQSGDTPTSDRRSSLSQKTPEQCLRRRFAEGELTEAEFRQKWGVLQDTNANANRK